MVDEFRSKFAIDGIPRIKQWLQTGGHLRVNGVLDASQVTALASTCDELLSTPGTPPVPIADHPEVLDAHTIRSIVRQVLGALPEPLPATSEPVILKRRTILRRTYPLDIDDERTRNANNQWWHQDSNMTYNDAPMLTLWIPLQDGAGASRPGLHVIDSPASYFCTEHGDSSPGAATFLSELFPKSRIATPLVASGDCIAFNGLTFHQTFVTPAMDEHRDALLVRIVEREFAHQFPILSEQEDLDAVDWS